MTDAFFRNEDTDMRCNVMRCYSALLGCFALALAGCSLCANCFDYDYAAYGGVRERTDPVYGRLGSAFEPASEVSYASPPGQSPAETEAGDSTPDSTAVADDDEPAVIPESEERDAPGETQPKPPEREPLPDIPDPSGNDIIELPDLAEPPLRETDLRNRHPLGDIFDDEQDWQ